VLVLNDIRGIVMPTDEQMYSRFIHGETEALDELLLRHKDGLTWFLYGIV